MLETHQAHREPRIYGALITRWKLLDRNTTVIDLLPFNPADVGCVESMGVENGEHSTSDYDVYVFHAFVANIRPCVDICWATSSRSLQNAAIGAFPQSERCNPQAVIQLKKRGPKQETALHVQINC